MNKEDLRKQFYAGIFFIVTIALLCMFIFTIGKNKGFAQKKIQIAVLFKNVGGLVEGAPVRLSGVNIGNVGEIDFLSRPIQGRHVMVTLNIFDKYKEQLQKQARVAIRTEGILGEKLVEISVLDTGTKLNSHEALIGEDPVDVADLTEVFSDAAASFTKTAEEMSQIDMVELAEVMVKSSRALLETSKGINEIVDELHELSFKSKRLFDRIEQKVIDGDLFKVF